MVLGVLLFSGLFFLLVQLLQGRSEVNLVASAACFVFAGLGVLVGGLSVRSGSVVCVDGSVSSVVFLTKLLPHVITIAAKATVKPIIKTVAINGETAFLFIFSTSFLFY